MYILWRWEDFSHHSIQGGIEIGGGGGRGQGTDKKSQVVYIVHVCTHPLIPRRQKHLGGLEGGEYLALCTPFN